MVSNSNSNKRFLDVKKIEQPRVKKVINFKKSSNPEKKRWRVSISIKVLYSNDGH